MSAAHPIDSNRYDSAAADDSNRYDETPSTDSEGDALTRRLWFRAALLFAIVLLMNLARTAWAADIAAVAVDAEADVPSTRALQVLALQRLQERGFATLDPPALRGALPANEARELAAEAGAGRLFVLQVATLGDAMVAGLSEVAVANGVSIEGASLVIDTPQDADRVVSRLVDAVVDGVDVDDNAAVATVTQHEGRDFAKRPGEFLWGLTLSTGVGAHGQSHLDVPTIYGGALQFFYEMEHAQFGVSMGGAGSEDGGLFDLSVRANWLMLDGDISPYLGGGFGLSVSGFDTLGFDYGGHAVLSGGVELFRLHAARLVAGVDVMLPFYRLEQELDLWDEDEGNFPTASSGGTWTPTVLFNVGVLF